MYCSRYLCEKDRIVVAPKSWDHNKYKKEKVCGPIGRTFQFWEEGGSGKENSPQTDTEKIESNHLDKLNHSTLSFWKLI